MRNGNQHGFVEAIIFLIPTLLAIGIGWWGLTQFDVQESTGLAALGFATLLLSPAAWMGARGNGVALTGTAGAVMMVLAAVTGSLHF
jgi:hypothetical protein